MHVHDDAVGFPYERVPLDRVAILVNAFKDLDYADEDHADLPLPAPSESKIAIILDGLGSSSAGLATAELADWISEDTDFEVCVFSYKGISSQRYQPRDTVRVRFDDLVEYLDTYMEFYSRAECIVLVGYSFGGLVISEWLYRRADEIIKRQSGTGTEASEPRVAAFSGSCLIATPIRLRTTRVYYQHEVKSRTIDARTHISAILDGYTAEPEAVPVVAPMVLFRCETDGLLNDSVFSFADRHAEDQPVEMIVPGVKHQNIVESPTLRAPFCSVMRMLCEGVTQPR